LVDDSVNMNDQIQRRLFAVARPEALSQNIFEFVNHTIISLTEFAVHGANKYNHLNWKFLLHVSLSISGNFLSTILLLGIAMTIARHFLNVYIFLPFCRWVKIRPADMEKFPESAWKFLVYLFLWSYSLHFLILSGRHDFFDNPCQVWLNYSMDDTFWDKEFASFHIPDDIYWLYVFSTAYYVQSLYGTLRMEVVRKDLYVMLTHHFVTLFLLIFSFLMKYVRIGALVLFLHDFSDMVMAFTKLNIYMKTRNNGFYKLHDLLSTVGFFIFLISWGWLRIYWYAMKVLEATNWCVYLQYREADPRMYLIFNLMLIMLEILHLYWFGLALNLLYKLATGQLQYGVVDQREYDVCQKDKEKRALQKSE
jgi:sphingoid base N-stearoyltransferase